MITQDFFCYKNCPNPRTSVLDNPSVRAPEALDLLLEVFYAFHASLFVKLGCYPSRRCNSCTPDIYWLSYRTCTGSSPKRSAHTIECYLLPSGDPESTISTREKLYPCRRPSTIIAHLLSIFCSPNTYTDGVWTWFTSTSTKPEQESSSNGAFVNWIETHSPTSKTTQT